MPAWDSRTARIASMAAAASMTPEQRIARARKANAARQAKKLERDAERAVLAAKIERKMLRKGATAEDVRRELDRFGLLPAKSASAAPTTSDEELADFYDEVDRRWPGLEHGARRKQAIFLLRSAIASEVRKPQ